jgi:hypothetical protein
MWVHTLHICQGTQVVPQLPHHNVAILVILDLQQQQQQQQRKYGSVTYQLRNCKHAATYDESCGCYAVHTDTVLWVDKHMAAAALP